MDSIIVFGAGGHAKVIADMVEKQKKFKISYFFDNINLQSQFFLSYPVFHNFDEIMKTKVKKGIIAVGHNQLRYRFMQLILENIPDFEFITVIDNSAQIAKDVKIGNGSVIMPLVCINSGTVIGNQCIVNTKVSLDHDNKLFDFVNISPGACLGGNVTINDFAFIGLGSNLIHKITIGKNAIIGAGSTVLSNIADDVLAYGSPCKMIRPLKEFENYL
jgi:sugar O-acyltransferase (sialic acid O-acetyltransferase NeuD family)